MIYGLIGENGSGKTTLFKCVTGIYKCNEGNVLIDGEDVYENAEVKAKIGYVADSNEYFPGYRLGKMVEFYKGIYKEFDVERFKELNQIFNLDMNKKVRELSKGQKMRLAFMLNIAAKPKVLVLDEPTSGLDAMAKKELFDVLIDEVEKNKITVLISSHNLSDIERICDDISIIKNGSTEGHDGLKKVMSMARKFQIVFENGAPEGFFNNEKIISYTNVGSIYTVIFNQFTDDDIEKIKKYRPSFMEEINLNLEEIFVCTKGGEAYASNGIS